ncbi:MAG: TetR/AcrR family transcriptional regulator [Deltaproteobacteria bacterium]|nr:TetR/AcrR family transcriptional regulator [Deltaproteobacteria bacterium]MCB9488966.1 TetR/AcrR family transcriptional regulator [Deltaproteobacteria bacterium]
MPTGSRRERDRRMREESILVAARGLFREKGVVGTTMDEIAEAASVSKPTIYAYFPSKNDIVCMNLSSRMRHFNDHLDKFETSPEPLTRLTEVGLAAREYLSDPDMIADFYFPIEVDFKAEDLSEPVRLKLEEQIERMFQRFDRAIKDGQESGLFEKSWDARVITMMGWSIIVGAEALARRCGGSMLGVPAVDIYLYTLQLIPRGMLASF